MSLAATAAREAIDDWVDSIELFVEDRDAWSLDNLLETTRHVLNDVPVVALFMALPD